MPSFTTLTLLLTTLTPLAHAIPPTKPPPTSRQPTANPLDFLDLKASNIYPSRSQTPWTYCAAVLDGGSLAFPATQFTDELVGKLECRQRLVFRDIPVGYAFTVIALDVSGGMVLGGKAFLDRGWGGVEYFSTNTTSPSEIDTASEDLSRRYHGGLAGPRVFNVTLNVLPEDEDGSGRTTRGRTACATADSQPGLELRFGISSSHRPVDVVDFGATYRASVRDVRVGLHVMWHRCE